MTVFSGIELLGALSSFKRFDDREGRNYFRAYWEKYLYTSGPRKNVGKGIYPLARHGIAHAYMVKGKIVVSKRDNARHLTRTGDEITIDVSALGGDFLTSYSHWTARHMGTHRNRVEARLREILDDNDRKARKKRALFRRLPALGETAVGTAVAPTLGPVTLPAAVGRSDPLLATPASTSSFKP